MTQSPGRGPRQPPAWSPPPPAPYSGAGRQPLFLRLTLHFHKVGAEDIAAGLIRSAAPGSGPATALLVACLRRSELVGPSLLSSPDEITVPVITIAVGDQRSRAAGEQPELGDRRTAEPRQHL